MRITFIATLQDYWGGSEELWVKVAELAAEQGHKVQVVVYSQKGGLHPLLNNLKKKVSLIEMPNTKIPVFYIAKALHSLKEKIFPFKLIQVSKFRPDCIVVNQVHTYSAPFHPLINSFLLKFQNPFFLISQFNSDHDVLNYNDILIARKILAKAKVISFVSERNKVKAEKQLATQFVNADVVGNHPNIQHLRYRPYPSDKDGISFASVARLEANYKGQDILLEILSYEKWKKRKWHLNFYGLGPDEQYLKELTIFYGLVERITFHGHVANIEHVWNRNHVLLLPSTGEGKPLALIEAMMCGRIGIASDVAGNAELIENEANGFIASSYFPKPFDDALEKAWKIRDQWEELGKSANERITQSVDLNPHETFLRKICS